VHYHSQAVSYTRICSVSYFH